MLAGYGSGSQPESRTRAGKKASIRVGRPPIVVRDVPEITRHASKEIRTGKRAGDRCPPFAPGVFLVLCVVASRRFGKRSRSPPADSGTSFVEKQGREHPASRERKLPVGS